MIATVKGHCGPLHCHIIKGLVNETQLVHFKATILCYVLYMFPKTSLEMFVYYNSYLSSK